MGIEIQGLDEAMAKISGVLSQTGDLTLGGMRDVLNDIGARAAEKAPKDTGNLRGSVGMWAEKNGDTVEGEISFNEKYAAYQHEHVELHHENGEAKYLEKAALEKYGQIREKVGAALNALFGGG